MICPPVGVAVLAVVLVAFIGARPVVAMRVLPAIVDLDLTMIMMMMMMMMTMMLKVNCYSALQWPQ